MMHHDAVNSIAVAYGGYLFTDFDGGTVKMQGKKKAMHLLTQKLPLILLFHHVSIFSLKGVNFGLSFFINIETGRAHWEICIIIVEDFKNFWAKKL